MNRHNYNTRNNRKGFTLVELLIVIVVISILAAISVVVFNGMQDRARNAQIASTVNIYKKAFELYYTAHGQYPTHPVVGCIGTVEDFPAVDGFGEGECAYTTGASTFAYKVDENVNSKLMEFISETPDVTTPKVTETFGSTTFNFRGINYESHPDWVYMAYAISRDHECAPGTEAHDLGSTLRDCRIKLYDHL